MQGPRTRTGPRTARSRLRVAAAVAGLVLACAAGGCASRNKVTFTNVSESWVAVRFFVDTGAGSTHLESRKAFQIKPGETATFSVPSTMYASGQRRLVHMNVQAVTPSWKGPGKQYWMELLTDSPVKIVARGHDDKLEFETGDGEVAEIPGRQLKKRFEYRTAGAPLPESP